MSMQSGFKKKLIATLVATACGAALMPATALASEADVMKKIEALQAEINALKAQVAQQPAASGAAAPAGKTAALSGTDGITVYGRLEMVAEDSNDGKVSRTVLQNISSRIGFRGERKINSDLSGIFQVETGVSPDDSANSGLFASRNSYVGLQSQAYGRIIAGKHDMPFKNLEGTANQLYGSSEAMEVIIHGKGTGIATGASWANLHTRQTNVFQYWSPKFSNIGIRLAYSPDEVNGATGTYRKPIYGGSIEFDDGMWNAGLATETKKNNTANGQNMNGVKATAGMKLGDGSIGLAYSKLDNDAGKQTDNWLITGSYKFGPTIFKANYGTSSETASNANDGVKMWALELDYPLDRNTTLFATYSAIDNAAKARGRFEAGDNKYSPVAGDDPSIFGLGIRYNF